MPNMTLRAGETRPVPTSGLYLSIVNADGFFRVESPEIGSLAGKTNRHFELGNIISVNFVNESANDIAIEYETANIKASSSGEANVSVQNEVVVKRIVEPQAFNAEVTTQASAPLVTDVFLPINDLVVPAGQVRKFADVRANAGRKVIMQTITNDAELSLLRIGSSNALQANQGVYLQGNLDSVATYEVETESEVWIRNVGTNSAIIAGGEQWRA